MAADPIVPIDPPEQLRQLAEMVGGTIDECAKLPDGSGFATMSMPLPKNHWLYAHELNGAFLTPPMRFRMGADDLAVVVVGPGRDGEAEQSRCTTFTRHELAQLIREAGMYAYRASSDCGKFEDMDPDAFLQNLVVALVGYHTEDGRSGDDWANPEHERGKR